MFYPIVMLGHFNVPNLDCFSFVHTVSVLLLVSTGLFQLVFTTSVIC